MESIFIHIVDLKKHYRVDGQIIKALDGVSLDIHRGEILTLLGVNGAGKTTLSVILATLHPPTAGDVLVNGKSIYTDVYAYRYMIGYCPQKVNLDQDLTVEQNLIAAGRYMGVPEETVQKRFRELMQAYNFERYRNCKPDILSGGYSRRVLIARALMYTPQLLILDEPTVGLDPQVRHQLWQTIRQLKEQGVTIVLTTHYLDEAEFLSDRICVLDQGKMRLIDTPTGLMSAYQKARLEDVFIQLVEENNE